MPVRCRQIHALRTELLGQLPGYLGCTLKIALTSQRSRAGRAGGRRGGSARVTGGLAGDYRGSREVVLVEGRAGRATRLLRIYAARRSDCAYPCCVGSQRGRATAAMPKPTSNSAQVNAGGEQFGRRVVPECVQVAVNAELAAHLRVPVRDSVRGHKARPEPACARTGMYRRAARSLAGGPAPRNARSEHVDARRVERDPANLVRLGVLLHSAHVATSHGQQPGLEVDVQPPQREPSPAHPGDHDEPDEDPQSSSCSQLAATQSGVFPAARAAACG